MIKSLRGAEAIAFAAEFAFRGGGAGAFLGFRQFLAAAGEAGFADGDASAIGAFGHKIVKEFRDEILFAVWRALEEAQADR